MAFAHLKKAPINYEFIIDIGGPELYIARRPASRQGKECRCSLCRAPRSAYRASAARRAELGTASDFIARKKLQREPARRLINVQFWKSKTRRTSRVL